MKEVTRIHIAKTAYDIEIAAKKQLEKYITSLEAYAQDKDVIEDIEIRITELLLERKVPAGGVIGVDDVTAIRSQLGEPYEFASEDGDIAVGAEVSDATTGRKLYRNTDTAVLGGVLSGIASYFQVNPMWTRLIFIIILFVSYGTVLLIYAVLWVVIPPARTATEKLQLEGKPVTLTSIRELNELQPVANRTARIVQRTITVSMAVLSALGALAVLGLTIWAVVSMSIFKPFENGNLITGSPIDSENIWVLWIAFWLMVVCGLLLTILFSIIAYAFGRQVITRKIVISSIAIVIAGSVLFGGVLTIGATESVRLRSQAEAMRRDTRAVLPVEFAQVKTVEFEVTGTQYSGAQVSYEVGTSPRYELSAVQGLKPVVKIDGTVAKVTLHYDDSRFGSYVTPQLTLYGPALETVHVKSGSVTYNGTTQPNLTILSNEDTYVMVSGEYTNVTATARGFIDLGGSAVTNLVATVENRASISAGTVKTLNVNLPDVCPNDSQYDRATVTVREVAAETIVYNGSERRSESVTSTCAALVIGEDDMLQ